VSSQEQQPDVWKGTTLADVGIVYDADIHYRIYNAATRALLSFGSMGGPGALNAVVRDALRVQAENPDVQLYVQHFQRSA
jgi:hypothetical protein